MLLELGVAGAIVGHSERRQLFGETDETVRMRAEAALEAGLHVIACIGETEAERESGETETVLARQVAGIPRHERLVIAYEPVWAIGTGKTATPEIAQETHAFVKSVHASPVLYGGSVKPDNAAVLLVAAGRGRRARRRRFARPRVVRGDLPRRRRGCLTPVVLVILDGWGIAPPGPGNAVELARTPVFDALWDRYPHAMLAASGEAVGLPVGTDGELGGRAPHDRVRPDPVPGPRACEPRGRGRLVRTEPRAHGRVPARARARRRRPSARTRLLRRRSLAHRPPARAPRAGRARGDGGADMGACVHGRARCVSACGGEGSGGAARCAHRNGLRALLRDGSRQPLGADRPRSRSDRVRRGHACRGSRRGGSRQLRAGSDRRVRRAGRARGASAPRSRRRRDLLQLPSRSGAAAVGAPARSGNRPDDDDALPRRLPVSRRLRRAGGRRTRSPRFWRPTACASSTSPRPRSTPM